MRARESDAGDSNGVPLRTVMQVVISDVALRKFSAFTMGMIGDAQLVPRLTSMLADGDADVRYNAALALARSGNAAAIPVLAKMLDPDNRDGVQSEPAAQQEYKAASLLRNALEGADLLVENNAGDDLSSLVPALEKLSQHELRKVRFQALGVLQKITNRDG